MKTRIWKDRETGRWCYDVTAPGIRSAGDRATWPGALAEALDDMRWISDHQGSWPSSLLPLGWRPWQP